MSESSTSTTTGLRSPSEWGEIFGIQVLDPDGWRHDGKPWDDPIDVAEYRRRVWPSTVRVTEPAGWDRLQSA